MKHLLILLLFAPILSFSQEINIKNNRGGLLSLGTRSTVSAFNGHEDESAGLGIGGQFRIQLADRVNTDWFADYITSDVSDLATRTDYHIGWSVLFYVTENPTARVKPYVLAGHCFDHTILQDNSNFTNKAQRWSSAVQGGIGTHFNLTPRLDLSLTAQYMLHLGTELHVEQGVSSIEFREENGASLEGHMLFNLSVNYKIADLW